ncbi:LLM class flavin-dependent oxidoreductase [Microbacterium pygmaeum]|uniref:LLM class flavin-dependent oxidoreductase n=1 Tax=Microbacterium pygmaeum TaxID=370764 RepID=UPI0012FB1826|nr:LLM class flavin-dependent oxidoreductase [Microbacterium pygmaeum]
MATTRTLSSGGYGFTSRTELLVRHRRDRGCRRDLRSSRTGHDRRRGGPLYIGGIGARGNNFYDDIVSRYGFEAEAAEIQDLCLAGRRADAASAVPDELVHGVTLLGDPDRLRRRIADFERAGVTELLLAPVADTAERRLDDVVELLRLATPVG